MTDKEAKITNVGDRENESDKKTNKTRQRMRTRVRTRDLCKMNIMNTCLIKMWSKFIKDAFTLLTRGDFVQDQMRRKHGLETELTKTRKSAENDTRTGYQRRNKRTIRRGINDYESKKIDVREEAFHFHIIQSKFDSSSLTYFDSLNDYRINFSHHASQRACGIKKQWVHHGISHGSESWNSNWKGNLQKKTNRKEGEIGEERKE